MPEKTGFPFGYLPFQRTAVLPARALKFRTTRSSCPVFDVIVTLTRAGRVSVKPIRSRPPRFRPTVMRDGWTEMNPSVLLRLKERSAVERRPSASTAVIDQR